MNKRLVVVLVAYAFVLLAYGHAGLPLGIGIPVVWANWPEADPAMRAISGLAAIGLVAFVAAFFFDSSSQPWRACAALTVATLVASAAAAVLISEFPAVTFASAVPFVGAVVWLTLSLWQGSVRP